MFGWFQKLGKALMLPVAVLPAAALLLRLGAPDVLNIPFIMQAGGAIFDNLALIFAIGVAIGFAFDNGGAAALAGAVGYFTLTKAIVTINPGINMGVLAGILSGVIAGALYNKFHDIKLPDMLGFFNGKRFVPIAASLVMIVVAGIFGYAWPPIQDAIHSAGEWIIGAGVAGAFVFGFLNRLLIPLGLHHVLNSLCWFVFGSFQGAEKVVTGDLNRFFAGDPTAGVFMTGFFPIMMFALPAAAYAMLKAARSDRQKLVSGLLISIAFTSFLTGITEPIEFLFMFLAPVLYIFHAVMTGVSLAIMDILGVRCGFGFSGGAIDYVLNYGLSTRGWLVLPIGAAFAAIYYFVFTWTIEKFNLGTPGRLDDGVAPVVTSKAEVAELAGHYLETLGGAGNINSLDSCITRLRMSVKDASKIDEGALKKLGAMKVLKSDNNIQVVVGMVADILSTEINKKIAQK